MKIDGSLSVTSLKKSIQEFVNDFQTQRTYFIEEQDQMKQVIVDKIDVQVEEHDLSSINSKKVKKQKVDNILDSVFKHKFNLNTLPLFCYSLIKLGEEKFIFVCSWHHIIADGQFCDDFINYISGKYNQLHYGDDFEVKPECLMQEYIKYEKESYLASEKDKDLEFWKKELIDVPLRVNIPDMRAEKKDRLSKGGESYYFDFDQQLSTKIKEMSRKNRSTPFWFLLTAWSLMVSRLSYQKDIVLNYPINIRPPKFRGLVGCMVNTALIKIDIDQTKSVSELIKLITEQRKKSKSHQRASLSDMVQKLRHDDLYEEGAFNLSFFEAHMGFTPLRFKNCKVKGIPSQMQYLNDLALAFQYDPDSEEFKLRLDYKNKFMDLNVAKQLELYFKNLVHEFIKDEEVLLQDINFLASDERKQILIDWNNTAVPYPKDKTIYQLFEEQVKKTPNNIAVIFEDQKLSYKELNQKSNQLAHLIRAKYKTQNKKDLKPDSLIGLCVERSLDMIIGILGILKAGGAYVPLDPDYPQDRLEYMIEDSHEGLIITQKTIVAKDGFLDKLHHDELLVIDSEEVKSNLKKQSDVNLEKVNGPDNLAYVIYTSGIYG